jgi:hypothetical protein
MDRAFTELTLTHASGASETTEALFVGDRTHGRIGWPAAFTGSNVLIECQLVDGGAWLPCNFEGVQLSIAYAASESERIPDNAFGCRNIRFKSDGTEAAARSIAVHLSA